MSGLFVSFEGIEGSGKTTQIKKLAQWFESKGREVVTSFEPGGTVLGQDIRRLILDPQTHFSHPYSEILLFTADRLEHVNQVIEPALNEGKVLLCDRYIDSTLAYQYGGRALPREEVERLISTVSLRPSLTLVLDISVEEGLRRAAARAEMDRFEQEDLAFHQRVRQVYLEQGQREPERVKVLDVQGLSEDEVFAQIIELMINCGHD